MTRPDRSTVAALVLVLLAAVAAVAAGRSGTTTPAPPVVPGAAADPVPVTSTTLVCPEPAGQASDRSEVAVGRSGPATDGRATVEVGPLDGPRSERPLPRGGVLAVVSGGTVRIDSGGAAARGLFAAHLTGTWAALPCAPPRGRWWFAGAGAGLDHRSVLVLANPEPAPALVDVRVLGPDGPVDTVGTRDLRLDAGAVLTLPLEEVAPALDEAAVEVVATRGRLVAAVEDAYAAGPEAPEGRDWLAGTDRPERAPVLAGLPADASARTLVVANPTRRQVRVRVEVAGARGGFVPTGVDTLQVPPGSVATADLAGALPPGEDAAVRLRASAPAVAAVRSVLPGGEADTVVAGPVPALTGSAAAVLPDGGRSAVQLTAGGRPAAARVVASTGTGRRLLQEVVRIPAGGTAALDLPGRAAQVLVEPLRGRVHGAVLATGPGGASRIPLLDLPDLLRPPPVTPYP